MSSDRSREKRNPEAFSTAWNAADSLDAAAEALGMTPGSASASATRLRKGGATLKKFSHRCERPQSRSERAARVAREEKVTFREAGKRFGISFQAVQQAHARLFPDERPVGWCGDPAARAVAVELSRMGLPDKEVAEQVGFSKVWVNVLRLRAGIDLERKKTAAFDAAVEAVRAGARAIDAAVDHGVSYNNLANRCRELGVRLRGEGARDGRAAAAADLVEREGLTVSEAARRMRCASSVVSWSLARRRSSR